MAVQKSLLFKN